MAVMKWRYVEVTFRLPDKENDQWRCILTEATSPLLALQEARRNTKAAHPEAFDIEEFMQRAITPQRADQIRADMQARAWEGWPFDRDTATI